MQADRHDKSRLDADPVRRMELTIEGAAGPVAIRFSAGIERFIGRYPRLSEIAPDGGLLTFAPVRD